jgi:tRNA1Val (adenine37-N6)-methyltransferase
LSSTTGFQFKQFTVAQDKCAMKVSLDACLFGALCDVSSARKVLDIGTGTGLLALMVAQRCHAHIDAVELDNDAAKQASENIANSPFASRIALHQHSIQQFQVNSDKHQYDRIICNPPFFSQHLTGNNTQRNLARHNDSLSFSDLCQSINTLLAPKGEAWLLLPQHEHLNFLPNATSNQLHLIKQYDIIARQNKPSKLGVWVYSKQKNLSLSKNSITIYQPNNPQYTSEFAAILADYYLKL